MAPIESEEIDDREDPHGIHHDQRDEPADLPVPCGFPERDATDDEVEDRDDEEENEEPNDLRMREWETAEGEEGLGDGHRQIIARSVSCR